MTTETHAELPSLCASCRDAVELSARQQPALPATFKACRHGPGIVIGIAQVSEGAIVSWQLLGPLNERQAQKAALAYQQSAEAAMRSTFGPGETRQ